MGIQRKYFFFRPAIKLNKHVTRIVMANYSMLIVTLSTENINKIQLVSQQFRLDAAANYRVRSAMRTLKICSRKLNPHIAARVTWLTLKINHKRDGVNAWIGTYRVHIGLCQKNKHIKHVNKPLNR